MKRLLCLLVILVAAVVPASAVENGFYLGGSVGGSSLEVQDFDEDFGAFRFSDGDTAYKIFAGFRFLNFLAVEAGYVDLGDPTDVIASIEGDELEVQIGVKGWDAFAIGLLPLGPVDLFAKVGVVSWDADIRAVLNEATDSDSDSGTDAAYGIGVALRLGKVALRAEGEQFNIADAEDVYMFSVGATFTF
ncbi:outer membrane beta-barrel protein [Acidobacteriota bacterium]